MKYIVNMTNEILLVGGMTVPPEAKVPVINKEVLSWPDVITLLDQKKIRIEETGEEASSPEEQP